jgi:hypothetical protein
MTPSTRQIGPFPLSPVGLGCMNLGHAYGAPPPADEAECLLLAALDADATLFDSAARHGFGANEALVGRRLKARRGRLAATLSWAKRWGVCRGLASRMLRRSAQAARQLGVAPRPRQVAAIGIAQWAVGPGHSVAEGR